jgi:hypothetical protein
MAAIPDDALGAFCRHTHAAAKGSGTGPLSGLTFGVKDIYDIAGHKTGFGSPDWLATHEAAAKTAIGGHDDEQMRLVAAGACEQLWCARLVANAGGQIGQHTLHLFSVGTCGFGCFLGALQLGCRDELHRARDLARRLHAGNAVAEIL